MATEITQFNTLIAQKATGIPYSTQWMVHFEIPKSIDVFGSSWLGAGLTTVDTQFWNIATANYEVIQAVQSNKTLLQGNALVQAVTVPGERLEFGRVGIENEYRGGYTQTPIMKSRSDTDLITVDFLETRNSFVDLVIRPWIILVGARGLVPISDDPDDSIKTELWAMYFDRGDAENNIAPAIRKKWVFHNAVPVGCDPLTTDYQANQISIIKTQWLYSHYTIESPENGQSQNITATGVTAPTISPATKTTSSTVAPTPASKVGTAKPVLGQPFSTLKKDPTTQTQYFGNKGVNW